MDYTIRGIFCWEFLKNWQLTNPFYNQWYEHFKCEITPNWKLLEFGNAKKLKMEIKCLHDCPKMEIPFRRKYKGEDYD